MCIDTIDMCIQSQSSQKKGHLGTVGKLLWGYNTTRIIRKQ